MPRKPQNDDELDFEIFEKVLDESEPLNKIVEVSIPQDEDRQPASITVTVVNWDFGDLALVVSDVGEYKLVSKDDVVNSYSAQSMSLQAFIAGISPYDWADEISNVALTPDQMRHILYTQGYVVKQEISLAELAKNLLVRGKIPVLRR